MKLAQHSDQIRTLFKAGASYKQIGEALGVSKQAVQQHLWRRGLRSMDGGVTVKKMLSAEEKRRKFRSVFGCTREQWSEYGALGFRRPFTTQRRNARLRNIPWQLTFGQFAALWIMSGVWDKRGCGADQFVMARFGDIGPYSWDNVEIITLSDNSTLMRARQYISSSDSFAKFKVPE